MRKLLFITLLTAVTSWANAQAMRNSGRVVISGQPAPGGVVASRPGHILHAFSRPNPSASWLYPFGTFSDFSYADALSSGYPVSAQPEVVVMQMPTAGGEKIEREAPKQALLIELRGDRYVRIPSGEATDDEQKSQDEAAPVVAGSSGDRTTAKSGARPAISVVSAAPARELTPAILLFRDGHSEQVRDYAIANGVIYARGDFYTDGYWTRKVELTALNLPETFRMNESRGVRFVLPRSPNEVITRP
jgi:hypothetical protein